jgi:hypothetical protein
MTAAVVLTIVVVVVAAVLCALIVIAGKNQTLASRSPSSAGANVSGFLLKMKAPAGAPHISHVTARRADTLDRAMRG